MLEKLKEILAWFQSGGGSCEELRKENKALKKEIADAKEVIDRIRDYIS